MMNKWPRIKWNQACAEKANEPFKDLFEEQLFIVKSGDGYFIEFVGLSPYLTSDPLEAARMYEAKAIGVIGRLWELGYSAELMEIRVGKIQPQAGEGSES
jgi:hypothetical protein